MNRRPYRLTPAAALGQLEWPRAWRDRRELYAQGHPQICASPGCGATPATAPIDCNHLDYNWDYPQGSEEWRSQVSDGSLCWLCRPEHRIVSAMHRRKDASGRSMMTPRQAVETYFALRQQQLNAASAVAAASRSAAQRQRRTSLTVLRWLWRKLVR